VGGDKVYFVSDRDGKYSLYAYDTKTKKVELALRERLAWTSNRSAHAATGTIAIEQFGTISLYDIKSKKATKVNIRVNSDLLVCAPALRKGRPPHHQCGHFADRRARGV
jgi:tricorn protease